MSKSFHASKNIKKKPMSSQKEKRAAKQVKKHNHEVQPFIVPATSH